MQTHQEVTDYIQGKLDRMHKDRLPSKEVRATLKFVTRKKKPDWMELHQYKNLINQVLTENGYAN